MGHTVHTLLQRYPLLWSVQDLLAHKQKRAPGTQAKVQSSSCAWAADHRLGTTQKHACSCQKQTCKNSCAHSPALPQDSYTCRTLHQCLRRVCSRCVHPRSSVTTQGGPRRRPRCCAPPPGCAPGDQGRAAAACPGDKAVSSPQRALIQSYVQGVWSSLPAIMIGHQGARMSQSPSITQPLGRGGCHQKPGVVSREVQYLSLYLGKALTGRVYDVTPNPGSSGGGATCGSRRQPAPRPGGAR